MKYPFNILKKKMCTHLSSVVVEGDEYVLLDQVIIRCTFILERKMSKVIRMTYTFTKYWNDS